MASSPLSKQYFKQSPYGNAQPGLSLGEIIVAMVLMTVLAAVLIPPQMVNTGEAKLLNMSKDAAIEIQTAYVTLAKNVADPTNATTAANVVAQMNYLRLITDSSQTIQVKFDDPPDGSTCTVDATTGYCVSTCTAAKPCAVLQNGGLLQYQAAANFNATAFPPGVPPYNKYALRFLYDPDGPTQVQTATSIYLFFGGRISTEETAKQDTLISGIPTTTDTTLPKTSANLNYIYDPEYIYAWTKEGSSYVSDCPPDQTCWGGDEPPGWLPP